MTEFGDGLLRKLREQSDRLSLQLHFTDKEQQILRMFYDERLKVRRRKVGKFYIYARICESLPEDEWSRAMLGADMALLNLTKINYLQQAQVGWLAQQTESHVGKASVTYELTAAGLEVLHSWHPTLGVRLRAWIAVAPPWVVLLGSILGGIGACWKMIEFAIQLVRL